MTKPKVFISSTSKDLKSYREKVSVTLRQRGVEPIDEEAFAPESHPLPEMLRAKIEEANAVICLLGPRYGADVPELPIEKRRSYTQWEFDIASELKRPVFLFETTDDCALDAEHAAQPEAEELRQLQRAHRQAMRSGRHLCFPFHSHDDLARQVALIKFDPVSLQGIQRRLSIVMQVEMCDEAERRRQLGDRWFAEVRAPFLDLLRPVTEKWRGTTASGNGNEFGTLLNFESSGPAVEAALELQSLLQARRETGASTPAVRIGIHLGEVIQFPATDRGQVLQTSGTIEQCRKLTSLALPQQILLTSGAFNLARESVGLDSRGSRSEPRLSLSWRSYGRYASPDCEHEFDVCEVGIEGRSPLIAPAGTDELLSKADREELEMRQWYPSPGAQIPGNEQWIIERKLGEGGFGEVWLAKQKAMRKKRVFKFCFNVTRLKSLRRELALFEIMTKHLGERDDIVRVHSVRVEKPPFYMESDYIESGDMKQWAARHGGLDKIPLPARLALLVGIARAVAAAHSLGIIHKDLKPANIFIEERGGEPHPRLADFGIGVLTDRAKLDDLTNAKEFATITFGETPGEVGTPLYALPKSKPDEPSTTADDVYALGVILYQVLLGRFDQALGSDWQQLVSSALPADLTTELLQTDIAEATRTDPLLRLSARSLADRLQNLSERRKEREQWLAQEAAKLTEAAALVEARRATERAELETARAQAEVNEQRAKEEITQTKLNEASRRTKMLKRVLWSGLAALVLVVWLAFQADRNARLSRSNAEAATKQSQLALSALNTMIFELNESLSHMAGGAEIRQRLMGKAVPMLQQVSTDFVHKSVIDHNEFGALSMLADTMLDLGNSGNRNESAVIAAEQLYLRSNEIALALAKADPGNATKQSHLAVSYSRLGNVLLKLGRTADALLQYEACLKVAVEQADANPDDAYHQIQLASSHGRLGGVYLFLGRTNDALAEFDVALRISRKLAEVVPHNTQNQCNLPFYYNSWGDVFFRLGRIDDALSEFEAGWKINQTLALADLRDTQKQRELASSYIRLGDVFVKLGRTNDAFMQFEASLKIARTLTEADSQDSLNQRELLIANNRLGDLFLKLGLTDEALVKFDASFKICRELADADPNDAERKRDLSIAFEHLGGVFRKLGRTDEALAKFEANLKIARALAEADPCNADKQLDLVRSYSNIGFVHRQVGRYEDAQIRYQAGLEIVDRLLAGKLAIFEAQQLERQLQQLIESCRQLPIALGEWEELMNAPAKELSKLLKLRASESAERGRLVEALQAADKLREMAQQAKPKATTEPLPDAEPTRDVAFYLAASAYSHCAGTFKDPAQQAERKKYSDLALSCLQDAINAGMNDAETRAEDFDLRALRELPEFQTLLNQLKDKAAADSSKAEK